VFLERGRGEICESFENVDDDGPPGDDVALLGFFVQAGKGAEDVCAESGRGNVSCGWIDGVGE
jgi:hypothetical protein